MKRISILGSTGSIGVSTLDVVSRFPELSVAGLTAWGNVDRLKEQILKFRPEVVAVRDAETARALAEALPRSICEILYGPEGYQTVATESSVQLVISSMVGAAGLLPTWAAVKAGKDVALANKEILVMAGELFSAEVARRKVLLLPIDSEHSAIFQVLRGGRKSEIKRIVLTASGGPFLRLGARERAEATPERAVAHPNWKMGRKISVDSATLMNKGLEIIEARWLFDLPPEKIVVVIHPQSVIHSFVEYVDGSCVAQMGTADMRHPIAYALNFPERRPLDLPPLDLIKVGQLTFEEPDRAAFPALAVAEEAAHRGGTFPAVLNAANETAVAAFLARRIGFDAIVRTVEKTLQSHTPCSARSLEDILEADRWARERAEELIHV